MSKTKNDSCADLCKRYLMDTYAQNPVAIVRGAGCRVWDADNMQYYDFTAGVAVQNVGHCHPKVVKAVQDQMSVLTHCSNLFYHLNEGLLAKKISDISGLGGKVFFCNSGDEANESLIKLARLWGRDKGRYEVVTMKNSYHGRTLATCAASGQSAVQEGYDPLPFGFAYAELNNIDSVREQINDRTAAVLVECIQSEGGVVVADDKFMKDLRALCDEKGVLLFCDEVQTGIGRTGEWFAYQNYGVKPDAVSFARGLSSGVPMGGIVATPAISDVFTPGSHGCNFGGNPLACSAALATIEVIESEQLLAHAKEIGKTFRDGLMDLVEKYDQFIDVRGIGLMIGLELDTPAAEFVSKLREMGCLACVAGQGVVRFVPPLTVSEEDVDCALDMVDDSADELFNEEE